MAYRAGVRSSHRQNIPMPIIICLLAYCTATVAPASAAAVATTARPVRLTTDTASTTNALALTPELTSPSAGNTPESLTLHYLRAFSAANKNSISSESITATAGPSARDGSSQQPSPPATHVLLRAFGPLLTHLRLWSGVLPFPHLQKASGQQSQPKRHEAQGAPGQAGGAVPLASRRGLRGSSGEGGGNSSSSTTTSSSISSSQQSQGPEVRRHMGCVVYSPAVSRDTGACAWCVAQLAGQGCCCGAQRLWGALLLYRY